MQTQTKPLPAVKSYRLFDGDEWQETTTVLPEPQDPTERPVRHARVFKRVGGCCAYNSAGNICGVTPAPFLDLQRGGMVCAEHHQGTEAA